MLLSIAAASVNETLVTTTALSPSVVVKVTSHVDDHFILSLI